MTKTQKVYTLDDLHSSINDIYYQHDEGKIPTKEAYKLVQLCCCEFLKTINNNEEEVA